MKRLILLIVVCTSIVACKKSDSGGPDLPLDTFTFGGTKYTATDYSGKSNYFYWGMGKGGAAQIYLFFNKTNATEGSFGIVDYGDTTSGTISIQLDYKPNGAVYYTSYRATHANGHLTVTMDGGYRVFSFPKVWAKASATDSVEISGYLKEYL